MGRMLSKRQVCNLLGISTMTLNRYMAAGRITYYKASPYGSSRVKFKEEDVARLLESFKKN